MTAAAAEATASRKPVRKLRAFIRLLPRTRLALGLRLRFLFAEAAQTALEVVEDEPHGRLGPRRRRDHTVTVCDEEHAAAAKGDVELHELRAVGPPLVPLGRAQQLERGAGEPPGPFVVDRRRDDRALTIEH